MLYNKFKKPQNHLKSYKTWPLSPNLEFPTDSQLVAWCILQAIEHQIANRSTSVKYFSHCLERL